MADTIRWVTPNYLEPGIYELQVLLRRSPALQVYEIEDFFRERDSFSGVPAATVTFREKEKIG